jgi:putative membrane protein
MKPPLSSLSPAPYQPASDRPFYIFNALLSAVALSFLAYILLIHRGSPSASMDLRFLPAVNASLNALAGTFLVVGYVAIRNRARRLHKYCMVSAFAASSLFLLCYLAYHFVHGDTKYQGTGPLRLIYYSVLATHVLLSMSIVPLALTSLYFAAKGAFGKHRRIARVTLPIWLYVSVTGVLIFFMLRGSVPAVH